MRQKADYLFGPTIFVNTFGYIFVLLTETFYLLDINAVVVDDIIELDVILQNSNDADGSSKEGSNNSIKYRFRASASPVTTAQNMCIRAGVEPIDCDVEYITSLIQLKVRGGRPTRQQSSCLPRRP